MPMTLRMDAKMSDVLDGFSGTDGYATTGYLVAQSEFSRPTVAKRLDRLHAAGCIEYIHEPTAFWRLLNDPREATDE